MRACASYCYLLSKYGCGSTFTGHTSTKDGTRSLGLGLVLGLKVGLGLGLEFGLNLGLGLGFVRKS